MIKGKKYEISGVKWIQENFDKEARVFGGADSQAPDIFSPKYGIIEVKHLPAQSGQFTENTASNYDYSFDVIKSFGENKKNNQESKEEICKTWVKNYYINHKKVNWFLVYEYGEIYLLSPEEYFGRYNFKCTYRCKKSGSRGATKKLAKILSDSLNTFWQGKKLYVKDLSLRETYFEVDGQNCYINDEGEVRILSNTKNPTYIFGVDKNDKIN